MTIYQQIEELRLEASARCITIEPKATPEETLMAYKMLNLS